VSRHSGNYVNSDEGADGARYSEGRRNKALSVPTAANASSSSNPPSPPIWDNASNKDVCETCARGRQPDGRRSQ
jgi:hypothetical protein